MWNNAEVVCVYASYADGGAVWKDRVVSRDSKGGCLFFFFQAEDGIRDYKVTGVQTCALPISAADEVPEPCLVQERDPMTLQPQPLDLHQLQTGVAACGLQRIRPSANDHGQIGRASCRERV